LPKSGRIKPRIRKRKKWPGDGRNKGQGGERSTGVMLPTNAKIVSFKSSETEKVLVLERPGEKKGGTRKEKRTKTTISQHREAANTEPQPINAENKSTARQGGYSELSIGGGRTTVQFGQP